MPLSVESWTIVIRHSKWKTLKVLLAFASWQLYLLLTFQGHARCVDTFIEETQKVLLYFIEIKLLFEVQCTPHWSHSKKKNGKIKKKKQDHLLLAV